MLLDFDKLGGLRTFLIALVALVCLLTIPLAVTLNPFLAARR